MFRLERKELKETVQDRIFLASGIIQFLVVSTLLFIYQFYSFVNTAHIPVSVTLETYDAKLVQKFQESGVSVIVQNGSQRTVYQSAVPADPRFRERVRASFNASNASVSTDVASLFSGFALARIKQATEKRSFEEALEQKGFSYSVEGISGNNVQFLSLAYGLIVPMAILLPPFVLMSLTVQGILLERKKKTLELLLVSPLSDLQIAFAKVVPYALLCLLFSALWLFLVSRTVFLYNLPLLLVVSFFFGALMVSLSVCISSFSASIKEANAWSSLVGMAVPLLVVLPYSSLSEFFPLAVMARLSSSPLAWDSLLPALVLVAASLLSFLAAAYSIRHLRQTAS